MRKYMETTDKRPPNAYILFCLEKRSSLHKLHPDLPNIEVSKLLGQEWKKMRQEEQAPYKTRARQLQADFKIKNPEYTYERARKKRRAKEMIQLQESFDLAKSSEEGTDLFCKDQSFLDLPDLSPSTEFQFPDSAF